MQKFLFCLLLVSSFFTAGCVAIDEAGIEGTAPDAAGPVGSQSFGPAALAGMWKGESNWDGAVKEVFFMVRQPVLERMVSPTPQAPIKSAESKGTASSESVEVDKSSLSNPKLTLDKKTPPEARLAKGGKPVSHQVEKTVSPTPAAPTPVWQPITDTGLVFWAWDIFFQISEKAPCNIQIIFKEEGRGRLTVVSQGGGTGNARFVLDGAERRIDVALTHPIFKEIKARILYDGDKLNGSFTLLGKEGIFKLAKDNSKPAEK